jgi:hypothetical protein
MELISPTALLDASTARRNTISRIMLARLDQDPNWPPWIPMEKAAGRH